MDWKEHYRRTSPLPADASLSDQLKQVGKTELGRPVDPGQLQLIERQIASALRLKTALRRVVDLGCGNGLITHRIAPYCQSMIAIDVSATMIAEANRTAVGLPIQYVVAEIDGLPKRLHDTDVECGFSYEVWQHLTLPQASDCLRSVRECFPELDHLFVGSLPDRNRIRKFYDTPRRWEFYRSGLETGQPHLGHWWTMESLQQVSRPFGFEVQWMDQPSGLYTSHYRFDALLVNV